MKKGFLKIASLIAGLAMIFAGCSSDGGSSSGPASVSATGVVVKDSNNATEGNLFIGDDTTVTLTATVSPENATVKKVEWSVTDSDAVTIVEKTDSTCKIKAGTKAGEDVLVSAKVSGSNVTGHYAVTVGKKLTEITVDASAETVKKAYGFKDEFDSTGVVVTAIYSDESTADVSDKVTYTFGTNEVSELNTYKNNDALEVNVSYTENGITKKAASAYKVSVDTGDWELGNISFLTTATKTEFNVGEEFDSNGVTATGYMVNKTTSAVDEEPVDLTAQLEFTGFDSSASFLGTEDSHVASKAQTITVKYDESNTATYDVTIKAIPVDSVTLSASSLTIYKNKEKTVTVKVLPENATFKKVNWSVSGNEAGYVTVTDAEGGKKITAGEAVTESPVTVTVTLADNAEKTASCAVFVKEQPKVTAWSFTSWSSETKTNVAADANWTKNTDNTDRYSMKIDGEAAANGVAIKELEGISFDKAANVLISFDSSKGIYLQTATSMEIPVEGGYEITFSAANTGSKNGTRKLVVTENGVATTVISSGNTTAATGKYTPKVGTSSIVVSFPDGGLNVYSIKGPVHATGLRLAVDGNNSVSLKEGVAKDITATITPSDALEKAITWTSDKPAIVKVENGKITPLVVSGETVTITAELENGVSAAFTVNGVVEAVKPAKVSMVGPSSVEKMGLNSTKTLSVSFEPSNVEATAIIWTSSDATTVSVDENGVITALKASTTPVTITATTVNGLKATYTVNEVIDPASITGSIVFSNEGGWMRACYAEWYPVNDATVTGYNAYVSKDGTNWTKLDNELIREYADYFRVDAMGLAAGNYSIKVTAVSESGETAITGTTGNLEVLANDRNGFAFHNGFEPGAYKTDGTLKDGAVVVYVNNANFNTVKLSVKNSRGVDQNYTGIQNALDQQWFKESTTPLVVRIIGTIDTTGFPTSAWGSSGEGLQVKGAKEYNKMPLTIEGVGEDATIKNFGILLRNTQGVELSNFGVMLQKDDALSLDTANEYTWVHNIDMFYGGTGGDADQAKGDGSLDSKGHTRMQTYSYNHFWDSGKCNLCGMHGDNEEYMTYQHNWYDHSDSRHPRIRSMSIHVYNNYFDGNAKYGTGVTEGANAFVENNYFRNAHDPMLSSKNGTDAQGDGTFSGEAPGFIKEWNNTFAECNTNGVKFQFIKYSDNHTSFDAYDASSRGEVIPSSINDGGATYNNFDTNSTYYIPSLVPDTPEVARDKVVKYAGRMNGGDFKWTFNNATDDASYAVNTALKNALINYTSKVKKSTGTGNVTGGYVEGGSDPTPTDPTPTAPTEPSLTLDKTTATVEAGSTVKITATAKNGSGSVTWTSSDETFATVSGGTVTGVKAGTATITATYGELTKTCVVTVTAKPEVAAGSGTWNAGETAPAWTSGLSAAAVDAGSYNAFGLSKYVAISAGGKFSVVPEKAGTIKVYAACNNNTAGKGTVTAKVDGTVVGTAYSMPNRKDASALPMEVTVSAANVGKEFVFEISYNAFVYKVVVE